MKDVTEPDYGYTSKICKDFEIKTLGEYHDVFRQSNTLLLAYLFEKFRNVCIKIYELDPARFLLNPELAWHAVLKRPKEN